MIRRVTEYLESKGWSVFQVKSLFQDLIGIQPAMGFVHFRTGLRTERSEEPRVDMNRMVPRVVLVCCRSVPITSNDDAAAQILMAKARALGCEAVLATMGADDQIKLRWIEPAEDVDIMIA